VKIFPETVGGAVKKHLGVLDALGIVGEADVDELGVLADLLEGGAGLVDIAVEHLSAGDLGHGVDQLRVEEALIARACLLGADLQLREGLRVGEVIDVAGRMGQRVGRERQGQGKKNSRETKSESHNAPLIGALQLLHVFEGDEAVAGLPLLVRKLAVCHGEELLVQVGRLFRMVELIVGRRR
jgi:hypothetical protein